MKKQHSSLSEMRQSFLNAARSVNPEFDRLLDNRQWETDRLLLGIRQGLALAKGNPIEEELLNQKKTVVLALNLGLIDKVIQKYGNYLPRRAGVTNGPEDYYLEAAHLLTKCAETFDPDRGTTFSTYVINSIERKFSELSDRNRSIFGTVQSGRDIADICKATNELEAAGEGTTPEMICERVHQNNPRSTITTAKITQVMPYMNRVEVGAGEEDDEDNRTGSIFDQPDNAPDPSAVAIMNELHNDIFTELYRHFTPEEADIVFDRLGNKLKESIVAERYNVDEDKIRVLCVKAKTYLSKSPLLRRHLTA